MVELQDSWHFGTRPASYRLVEEQGKLLLSTSTSSVGTQIKHDAVFESHADATAFILQHAGEKPFVVLTEHEGGRYTLERYE